MSANLYEWTRQIIHGPGGMNSYEAHELAMFDDDRLDAARWVLRCLANPNCEGSADVLAAIIARRGDRSTDAALREQIVRDIEAWQAENEGDILTTRTGWSDGVRYGLGVAMDVVTGEGAI